MRYRVRERDGVDFVAPLEVELTGVDCASRAALMFARQYPGIVNRLELTVERVSGGAIASVYQFDVEVEWNPKYTLRRPK